VVINGSSEPATLNIPVGNTGDITDILNNDEFYTNSSDLELPVPATWGRIIKI
jgi:hypothetical protein